MGFLYTNILSLTVDQIAARFPHKVFTIIKLEPDYQSIHYICTLLYSDASTFSTTMVGDNHGHIHIDMQETLYVTILLTPYNVPVYPGGTVQVPYKILQWFTCNYIMSTRNTITYMSIIIT